MSLVARYTLNETSGLIAHDSVNGLNGTLTNMNGNEWNSNGRWNGCLTLDSIDDYVRIANDARFNTPIISVSVWMYQYRSGSRAYITKGANGITLQCNSTNGIGTEPIVYFANGGVLITSPTKYSYNTWINLVCIIDGVNKVMKMYVNSTLKGQIGFSSYTPTTDDINLGFTTYYDFNGLLDEVRWYNHALSQDEINWLYQYNQDTPILCWNYTAKYKDSNRLFRTNGSGKFPSELKVPQNVDINSGIMIDEGKLIDPSQYKVI